MNYITQINTFYGLLPVLNLNADSQCLYFALLNINNRCNWIKCFTVSNTTLMSFTGLSMSALQRARNFLVQKKLIDYRKGNGNQAGSYLIVDFEQQTEQQIEQQINQQSEQQTGNKLGSKLNTLIKTNKTKLNKKEVTQRKVFVKPTVEEVKAYCLERNNGIDANKFVDFYESKGWKVGREPMKDWKACVRTWESKSKENPKQQGKPTNAYHNPAQSDQFDNLERFYT